MRNSKKTNMRASKEIKKFIKGKEGLRLHAYKCPAGVWTIGYGHTNGVEQGQIITQEKADKYFDDDIYSIAEYPISDILYKNNVEVNQDQFDALCSFVYNVGIGNFKKSTLLKKVLANPNDTSIAGEFKKWNKSGGKELSGLTLRRELESYWYFGYKQTTI